jgi:hypothetical protein
LFLFCYTHIINALAGFYPLFSLFTLKDCSPAPSMTGTTQYGEIGFKNRKSQGSAAGT